MMPHYYNVLAVLFLSSAPHAYADETKPTTHTSRHLEGWTIRVDSRLFEAPNVELGQRALRFLENKLADIKVVVPAERLQKLQAVTIVLDLSHGKLTSMQYHPSASWLKANGYAADLAKCVHIPRAADLPTRRNINEQPWVILHELAHAYHDQVLGFNEPRIQEAYDRYKKSGAGDRVLLYDGRRVRHYALTDAKEFFAEMTETYFGVNDFFPFNRAELKESHREIYDLMRAIWEPAAPVKQSQPAATLPLDQKLSKEDPSALARDARASGNAARGALFFYQAQLACAKCHRGGTEGVGIGPDLTKPGKEVTDAYLVESILKPSKVIKKGFETIALTTNRGQLVTGILAEERPDAIVLRDPNSEDRLVTVPKREIDERRVLPLSSMPEGLINQLQDRGQFLDLVRYVMEISEKGPERMLALRPSHGLFAPPPLPEYERNLDHAGLIRALDGNSLKRGAAIYKRVCAQCHGTKEQIGSMPTSLRFAGGTFKNGSDPYAMYQTLTNGYGLMTPQRWMAPKQKYDVIHYIRETYLKDANPTQYFVVHDAYLARLPKGAERGPEGTLQEPWLAMDYGPNLNATYEIGASSRPQPGRAGESKSQGNFAYKGIAIRLDAGPGGVSRGQAWMMFDHDTMRMAAAWSGSGFMDWNGINFNGEHQVHPRLVGTIHVANPIGPGWANPDTGSFDDPRLLGRDGKRYGPLPRPWAQYRGLYHFGQRVIVSYTVGKASILETADYEINPARPLELVFSRTLNISASPHDLLMRVAPAYVATAVVGDTSVTLLEQDGFTLLRIPAKRTPLALKVLMADGPVAALQAYAKSSAPAQELTPFLQGGPKRWPEIIRTSIVPGQENGAFAVDVLEHPEHNPWLAQTRLTGFDFYPDGDRAAVCSWDGDVWLVKGLSRPRGDLSWQRIASGLFQPLGLRIVAGEIFVCCRDQIVRLHDLNGDGEIDFYENFNNDHQVTDHFHEFAMGLQTDADGNFYYARAARHGLKAVVPQHGTLLRVSKDGTRTDILATGFRAPNGVCVNPDGTFFLTDQEGFWLPKNRINLVKVGSYHGNFWGYHDITDPSDKAMAEPVCWITNDFDRSPSELLWVTSDRWGPLQGALLNFSYGYGKVYVVPYEKVGEHVQGGMCALPLPQFPTGVMRGRFHPVDGQLYCCGMYAWAGNQTQPGGFYRVRYTGKPVHVPIRLQATTTGMTIHFSGPLDRKAASDPKNYAAKTWALKRSANYGSKHYDEKPSAVTAATVSDDGKTVALAIADMKPTWCMEIRYHLQSSEGIPVPGVIHNTVHQLGVRAKTLGGIKNASVQE
jgi:putative heme-binding domain-containing protein